MERKKKSNRSGWEEQQDDDDDLAARGYTCPLQLPDTVLDILSYSLHQHFNLLCLPISQFHLQEQSPALLYQQINYGRTVGEGLPAQQSSTTRSYVQQSVQLISPSKSAGTS